MTSRLHTLQYLQGELPHRLWQNVQLSESFDCPCQSDQTRSFQVYCHYAVKAGLELYINTLLVGHPYILMQWF